MGTRGREAREDAEEGGKRSGKADMQGEDGEERGEGVP